MSTIMRKQVIIRALGAKVVLIANRKIDTRLKWRRMSPCVIRGNEHYNASDPQQ